MSTAAIIGGIVMMLLQLVLEILQRNPPDPRKDQKERDARLDTAMAGPNTGVALELHRIRERLRHEGTGK